MPKSPETFQCSVCCPTTTTTTAAPTTTVRPTTTANPNTTTANPNTTTANPNTTTANPNTTTVGPTQPPEPSTTPPPVICACCSKGLCKCKEIDGVQSTFSLASGFIFFVHRPYPEAACNAIWNPQYNIFTASDIVETDKAPLGGVMPDGRKRLQYQGTINNAASGTQNGNLYSYKTAGSYQQAFAVNNWNGSTTTISSSTTTTWVQLKETNNGIYCSLYARPKTVDNAVLPVFDDVEWTKVYSTKKTELQDGAIRISLPSEWFSNGVTGVDLKINVCTKNICRDNPILQYECAGQASWITNPTVFSNEPECSMHGTVNRKTVNKTRSGGIDTVSSTIEYTDDCFSAMVLGCPSPAPDFPLGFNVLNFVKQYAKAGTCNCSSLESRSDSSQFVVDVFLTDFNEKDGKITLQGTWINTLEKTESLFDYDEYYTYWVLTNKVYLINTPREEYKQGTITITRL